jgi:ABC-2 type transport system ATP-binding protein
VDICGLKEVFFRPIGTLSKGYRQRVGLAQALIHEPDILILDEPTSGLDPKQIIEIRDLITHIGKSHTVLLSTHILQEVKAMCSRVLMINRGKIVASDTIENLEAHAGGRGILHTVIKGAEGKVKHGLEGLKGVVEVKEKKGETKEHGVHSYLITVEKAGDVREELFDLAVKEGWKILESTQKKVELEDVFLELTR